MALFSRRRDRTNDDDDDDDEMVQLLTPNMFSINFCDLQQIQRAPESL